MLVERLGILAMLHANTLLFCGIIIKNKNKSLSLVFSDVPEDLCRSAANNRTFGVFAHCLDVLESDKPL